MSHSFGAAIQDQLMGALAYHFIQALLCERLGSITLIIHFNCPPSRITDIRLYKKQLQESVSALVAHFLNTNTVR